MLGDDADVYGEEQLDDLKNDIEEVVEVRATSTVKREIERTVKRVFSTEILPAVRGNAEPHVGEYASEIYDVSVGWEGDTYRHGIDTNSVVVRSHEHGTGQYNVNGNGTTNATSSSGQVGYRIPSSEMGGPVAFNVGGKPVVVDYVVHPGVRPKQFMSRTVDQFESRLADAVEDAVMDALDDAFDTTY